jgi:hypothetical protein
MLLVASIAYSNQVTILVTADVKDAVLSVGKSTYLFQILVSLRFL